MSEFMKGKVINDIKIAEDGLALAFHCIDGVHIAKVDAECCSYTWIENVDLPSLGFPCEVVECRELELSDRNKEGDFELIQFYGYELITTKGVITIDYRNESNGYYGGDLVWPDDDYFCGGVYGQANSNNAWVDVNDYKHNPDY